MSSLRNLKGSFSKVLIPKNISISGLRNLSHRQKEASEIKVTASMIFSPKNGPAGIPIQIESINYSHKNVNQSLRGLTKQSEPATRFSKQSEYFNPHKRLCLSSDRLNVEEMSPDNSTFVTHMQNKHLKTSADSKREKLPIESNFDSKRLMSFR